MKSKKIKTAVGSLTVKTSPVPIYEYLFILTDSTVETDKILLAGEKKKVIPERFLNDLLLFKILESILKF